MSNELTCPVCGSHNCNCTEKPHQHRCLDCKYDGTEPIEWAAVRLCHEQRVEIERLRGECVYLESDARLVATERALQALVDATANPWDGTGEALDAWERAHKAAQEVLAL